MNKKITGLTYHEVDQQVSRGNVNVIPKTKSKSNAQIIMGHTFNLFNLYNVVIAAALVFVGEYLSVFFLNVIIMNIAIRSFQEIRSKRIVENLNILIAQDTKVIREGNIENIPSEALVLGDVVLYRVGDQVSADAVVIEGTAEMNESNLTGESVPVMKNSGEVLLSGSFVTSGTVYARTTHVGLDSFAQKITNEARNYTPIESELMETFLRITRWCTRIVLPIGIILVVQAMVFRHQDLRMTVLSTSTVLLGLLPKGLILLTSLSFGVSVFRLAQKRTLVQEIYSIEVLSKVDVLCIDKTGTLTAGEMTVQDVIYLEEQTKALPMISTYVGNSTDSDSTTLAMKSFFSGECDIHPIHVSPFSSARKWGSMTYEGHGTVFLGAPEFLIDNYELPEQAIQYQSEGARVLLVARTPDELHEIVRPDDLIPTALIAIADPVRLDVYDSLDFFKNNEVNVKVISGDNINTLMAVATKTGIQNGDKAIDVSQIESDEELEAAVLNYNVIGRASPYQKQKMVKMLQQNGQRVAMVGDGVNDVLALRSADCSIAMGAGSSAARQAAQIILLDNEFTTMVDVVMEGRLVTNNISRSASMYYLGTLLTFLLALVAVFMNTPYPFTPLQVSIMSMFVEGMPSSFVTFESNYAKPKEAIIPSIMKNIFPNAAATAVVFVLILFQPMPLPVRQTMMYFVTIFLSLVMVVKLFQPMNWKRIGVIFLSATSLITVCYFLYKPMHLARLNSHETVLTVMFAFIGLATLFVLTKIIDRIVNRYASSSNVK
ncbi:HAD-IC family P-type ATPase [Erysipelothrix anatis]|uniref:HAD-IC family P-type ATPase n=1 Tax=Erysipelothrix anatis TaxID=2683713 RepID=UPI0013591F82|nr:HAD-IC family P-type ATPase [Erysipelothrix anatis]